MNDSLQGPVAEVLARFVPELRRLPAGQAYHRVLDDIGLLQDCFSAFRAQRDSFRAILVDERLQPVADDRAMLSCGRTLEQVVAMIVRTAAKRYFRRKLGSAGNHHQLHENHVRQGIPARGVVHRITQALTEPKQHKTPVHAAPVRSKADELYDAIKHHLLHEWQVPLVPTYADMSPSLARALGDKLLDLRTPEDLRRVVDDPDEAAKLFDIPDAEAAEANALAASAGRRDERARLSEVLTPDGRRLRTEAFGPTLLRPDVRSQLTISAEGVRLGETLRMVGGMPAKLLVAELGLRVEQLAVFLLVAHEALGPNVFERIFGQPGQIDLLMRITQKARLSGLNQRSPLADCARFVRELFARFEQSR
ncbi:MAG TPA: hypothetical protein VK196_03460 [Magnetospirillum sp.]|nr:hypothetical protein [Magnetospirillum sp.]